jgi:hypothetical protein
MNAIDELAAAKEALAIALDAKLANMPEWQAYRRIERAVSALEKEASSVAIVNHVLGFGRSARMPRQASYADLAIEIITKNGAPLPTPDIVAEIGKIRDLGSDPEKARVNVSSSMSKDPRIANVPWRGGKAWWISGREVPRNELAEHQDEFGADENETKTAPARRDVLGW